MQTIEIICLPAIVSITYGVIELYKKFIVKGNEKLSNLIPLIALLIGGIMGVVLFYIAPDLIIADSVYTALIVGLCSGLSATGTNQIFKQLNKLGIEVKETNNKE